MRREEELALLRRTLALVEQGRGERGEPSLSPVARYLDEARYRQEIERVFRRFPIALGPSADLAEPGACRAIDVAGMPLLLVRGDDGRLRGFINACRHRGARLRTPGVSHQRVFVCPYHSWSYAPDGRLRGRPHAEDFAHAPAAACSLVPVPAGEALGFAWAIPRPLEPGENAVLDLSLRLGRFGEDLRSWGYDRWVPFQQREFSNAANWKVPVEANLETYHVQYAHRDTIADLFHDNLVAADHDGPHQRLVLAKRTLGALRALPESDWRLGDHANVIYFFFPATLVLHEGDHCNAFSLLPEGVGQCRVLGSTLIPEEPASDKARGYWQRNVDSFWHALAEDFSMGVSVQSTLSSGANESLRLGAAEFCSARFHADVEALLAPD